MEVLWPGEENISILFTNETPLSDIRQIVGKGVLESLARRQNYSTFHDWLTMVTLVHSRYHQGDRIQEIFVPILLNAMQQALTESMSGQRILFYEET